MNDSLASTLVLCDLDNLLLGEDGNLTQVVRDVLQLFSSRGGRLTVFSQRSPRAVRSILGSVRLAAPALVCGGTMAYHYADGNRVPLCSFAQQQELFACLPDTPGVGVAVQMQDGTTRVLRMSNALERHLRQEWTPYLLANAADIHPEQVLRVLLYQDSKSVPLISLAEKAIGDRVALLGDPDLMDRVEKILNWTLDCGMVAIINIHHENEWIKQVPTDSKAKEKFTSIWKQICERFEKYGDHLLFEPMNEIGYDEIWTPWGGSEADKAKALGYVNDLNQLFVDIVRNSGGNNAKRHLLVEIYNTNLEYAYDPLFKMPNDPANRLALTVHYYTPANFAILGGGEVVDWGVGRESWGTEADFKELNDNMDLLKKNCVDKGIPVIIGEYCADSRNRTKEVIRLFCVSVTEAIYSRGMCPMLWDTPGGQYNRQTCQFDDPLFLEEMMAIPVKYPRN